MSRLGRMPVDTARYSASYVFRRTWSDSLTNNPPMRRVLFRSRTQDSLGTVSGSGPLRLALGPCASLPPDLMEDPTVARIVSST